MKLSNSQDQSYQNKKRQSLFEISELGKTINRINSLPINIQDHGDHWKRITDLAEQSNPSVTMHQPTLRRSSENHKQISETSGKYDSQSVSQQSRKTRPSYSSEKTVKEFEELTVEVEEESKVFDRYTEFGGIKSQETVKVEDEECDKNLLSKTQFNKKQDQTELILHTNRSIRKQMSCIKDHPKPQPFPDRQLYIYVIADPTDMRIELTNLRMYVWPYLQRICNERGFTLNIIDDNMDTDIEPRNQLMTSMMNTSYDSIDDYELKQHLSRRMKQKNFLNCLILLSNRSVGPIVQLPQYLPNNLIKQIKNNALEEIEDIKSEITMLSEKLPGFDSPRLQRRLSKYLGSQTSLGSLTEEVTMKQSNMSPISDAIPNRRNTLKFSNVTPIQMTQIEDSIRQKSEIIRTLNPDILDKWYCPTSDSHPDISYLQPVSQVLPGITCFDDQNIRQAELKSWLNDSHRIRCLLMRFSDQSQINSSSATSYRLSDMEIPTPNTERIHSNTDSIPNSNRQTDMTDRSSYVKEKYNFQSEVERQIELVLQNNELNSDCFVHIRYHQDNKIPSKKSTNINDPSITSWRSRSLSLASWSTTRTNVNTTNSSSSSSIKNEFLSSAFNESLARAKLLVNWARLKVPANNQSHYELEKSALITLNDQIHCTQSYLDPINYQEHAIYLDDLCRNIRNKFSQSLIEEMNRRSFIEMENRINKQVNYLYHWCLEYEISAHLEMMERLSSMYIAREELLMELYNSIIKHTINCQENNGTNRNYFSFIQIKGESGSGKSVLLASLAKRLLTESMKVNTSIVNPRVIYRMIGSSTMSLNLLNLLSYLCIELSTRMNNSSIPDTYDGLRTALHTAIIEATYEQSSQQPLIIILDGIENIEECKQRKENFPISWIPFSWIKYKPILNCPVIFIISTINNPDEIAYFNKNFQNNIDHFIFSDKNHTTDKQISSTNTYRHILLNELDFNDMNKCIKVWLSQIQFINHYDTVLSMIKTMNKSLQPLQLKIIIQLYRYEKHNLKTIINDIKDYNNYDLYNVLIKYTEKFYGIKRVQFIIGNLFLSRLGLTNEDLINLFWLKLPMNHCTSSTSSTTTSHHLNKQNIIIKQKRFSLQDIHYNILINDKIDRVLITYNWLYRFFNEFLLSLNMIIRTRSPPYGCYILYNMNQQLLRYWIEHYYINNHQIQLEYHTLQLNVFYNQHKYTTTTNTTDTTTTATTTTTSSSSSSSNELHIHWRWLSEVPYHLSKLNNIKKLKKICFFNFIWLNYKLQLLLFTDNYSLIIQNCLDEFVSCLLYNQHPISNKINNKINNDQLINDLLIEKLFHYLYEYPDIHLILSILIQYRYELNYNPYLLNNIIIHTLKEYHHHYQYIEPLNEQTTDELNKSSMIETSIKSLIYNIEQYNIKNNIQIPSLINFNIPTYLCTYEQIINNLTYNSNSMTSLSSSTSSSSSSSSSSASTIALTCSRKTIQINAIAYSNTKQYLAISTYDLIHYITILEIWNINYNYKLINYIINNNTIQIINELIWIGINDNALLGIEIPSQNIYIWPLKLNESPNNDDGNHNDDQPYYLLTEEQSNIELYRIKENSTINVVDMDNTITNNSNISYIIQLQQGIYKLSIWLWKDNKLKHLIGPLNLIDKPQHIKDPQFLNDPKQKSLRSISLPNTMMKSNTELLISSYIYNNKLYIITGYKGDSKAIMFHINILFNNYYYLDDKQSIQQIYLLCPNQGTRILGIYSQLTQSIIIIPNRSPSIITLNNNKIIDCIDLFNKQSGNFIKHIESINNNTFSYMEPYLNNFNIFTTFKSLPKLFMYYDINNEQFITIIQNYTTNNYNEDISNIELITIWDLNKSITNKINMKQLLSYIIHDHYTMIIPLKISIKNINQISMIKPILEENNYRIYNYQFIFNGKILITLEKLEYSIIVEECKEVYQRMGIYEIDYNPTNEFHLNHIRHLTDVFIIPNHITEYKIIYSNDPDTTSYLLGLNETRSHFVAYNLLNGQVIWRLKPDFSIYPEYKENSLLNIKYDPSIQQKSNSYLKNNTIEKFLISGNQSILIVSYSMECVCVFLMNKLKHVGYLDENYAMMNNYPLRNTHEQKQQEQEQQPERLRRFNPPNLSISAISYDGYWLVHTEYSHEEQCTCLTIWSLIPFHINNQLIKKEYNISWIRKRLLNQSNLIQLIISNYNCIIIGARINYGLICWCPCKQLKSIYLQGSQYLKFSLNNPPLLNISNYGNQIISISGYIKRTQITIWQLNNNNDLTICLISNLCYIDNIIELQLINEKLLLCITVMNLNKPLLIDSNWNNNNNDS
ncbi:unnamed protein product [Schistosoma rodhaini]|uniref:Uncharacterized protein n=1 Tax=Schistosoma rodhaini TaxID=6188 RepID=A0AA85G9X4_9TREM|nr:unnamed protein product [Schistosoma rodhaini]CAH8623389.1 unnamed protein product [Schistosoma rodhaini]